MGPAILRLRIRCLVEARSATHVSLCFLDSATAVVSANRADGKSEIEGKAAKGSGERVGKSSEFQIRGSSAFSRNASENFTKYMSE